MNKNKRKKNMKKITLIISIMLTMYSTFVFSEYQVMFFLEKTSVNFNNTPKVNDSIINSFNASSLNVTKGGGVIFSWNVSDSEKLNLSNFGSVYGIPTGTQYVNFDTAGSFDFTLSSTSLNGTIVSSMPIGINVYNPSLITSYTINGSNDTINASPNQSLYFDWTAIGSTKYKLNGDYVNGNSKNLSASSYGGITEYTLSAFNGAGDFVTKTLAVNVVEDPIIGEITAPSNVFSKSEFTLSWTGTNVSYYKIRGNVADSGLSTTDVDLGMAESIKITPAVEGSYTYTITATNSVDVSVNKTYELKVMEEVWVAFANLNGLNKNWNSIGWDNKSLKNIPTEPYPLTTLSGNLWISDNQLINVEGFKNITNVSGGIDLGGNKLTNIDGLRSLKSVGGSLNLQSNQLTNINGLKNLISIGSNLNLQLNQLTNIDGLTNLKSVGGHFFLNGLNLTNINGLINLKSVGGTLDLKNNQLTNVDALINLTNVDYLDLSGLKLIKLDGLANVQIGSYVYIDNTYTGPKLEKTTRFCSLNAASKFIIAPKTKICKP